MLTAVVALLTALVAGMFGAFFTEMYKRHRDAAATAAAIAGELASYKDAFAMLDLSLPRLIAMAQKGIPLNMPEQGQMNDVAYEAYVDRTGLLGSKLAEDVTYVYGQLRGFRLAFKSISGQAGKDLEPAYVEAHLRVGHLFLSRASERITPLVEDLRSLARKPFWEVLGQARKDVLLATKSLFRSVDEDGN